MSELTFTDESAPATTRKVKPNPYIDVVKTMIPDSGKAKGFDTKTDPKSLAAIRRQLTAAGDAAKTESNPLGVTVRWDPQERGDGVTHVTFYAVSKIKRAEKSDEAEADTAVETPAETPAPKTPRTRASK